MTKTRFLVSQHIAIIFWVLIVCKFNITAASKLFPQSIITLNILHSFWTGIFYWMQSKKYLWVYVVQCLPVYFYLAKLAVYINGKIPNAEMVNDWSEHNYGISIEQSYHDSFCYCQQKWVCLFSAVRMINWILVTTVFHISNRVGRVRLSSSTDSFYLQYD